MSMSFAGRKFTFTQPDGTAVEVIGWGDQHAALFQTQDGHPVVRNPDTGFYEYAAVGPTLALSPTGARAGIDPAPVSGLEVASLAPGARTSLIRSNPGLPEGGERWRTRAARKRAPAILPELAPAPPSRTTVGSFVGL